MHVRLTAALNSCALLLACWIPASADSTPTISTMPGLVEVGINFAGANVLVEGRAVEGAQVIVKVSSEPAPVKLSKKGRVMGIFWMTTDTAVVQNMPSFHMIYSSQPLGTLLGKQEQVEIGADAECTSIMSQARVAGGSGRGESISPEQAREYVVALRDIYIKSRKYVPCVSCHSARANSSTAQGAGNELSEGRVSLSNDVWQVSIKLPADAPLGNYDVTAYFVRDKKVVASQSTSFIVQKTGLEQWLGAMAVHNAPVYGLVSVGLVVLAGLCIGLVFPKAGH